jgi:hypothetical protein
MPEHVPILIQTTSHDVRVDLLRRALEAAFSRRIRRHLEAVGGPLLERLMVLERPGTGVFDSGRKAEVMTGISNL